LVKYHKYGGRALSRDCLNFPNNFIWGTSTAGHQVEGGNEFSDWWAWERKGLIEDGTVSGRAMDYWNRHEEDHALMAKLAYKGFRLGIEWARVEPRKDRFDRDVIEHYRRILQSLVLHCTTGSSRTGSPNRAIG
jgi:beta-glucosidase